MNKTIGKQKTTKDKAKKSDRQDEGLPFNSKKSHVKDREKSRSRNLSRKKKANEGGSPGDASPQSSDDGNSLGGDSQTVFEDHSDVHRLKGKKVSKECEEAVQLAVSDIFECAWLACAERFFITSASAIVSFELRNTWLRVVEAEWQDPEMREKPSANKHNRIFLRDQPPLPLAFDTWSRGAIEPLPGNRRESVMDPFLRDLLNPFGKLPVYSHPPS